MNGGVNGGVNAGAPLPGDWQDWVRLNVARGCSRNSMLQPLLAAGFDEAVAAAAIDAQPPHRGGARPQLCSAANTIQVERQAVRVVMVLEAPQVIVFENLLSESECAALAALAEARMAPSTVVDDAGGPSVSHHHRSSHGAFFSNGEGPLIAAIEARIATLLTWPASHGEGLQVLRYAVGGEYRAHFDYFDPTKPGSAPHLARGGQRVGTLVMYLGDVAEGGGTRFPTLGLELRPRRGGAVYFASVNAQGDTDPATLHAGMPVLQGVKLIATKWLRERMFAG